MSDYESAENRFITVGGVTYAYRLFGLTIRTPLFLFIHFRGNMDSWDPKLLNPIALTRPIILIDNSGVGRSTGTISSTFAGWAKNVADVLSALSIPCVDVLGFSMGGYAAQMLALNHPSLVRKLIIAGSGPSIGPGVENAPTGPFKALAKGDTEEDHRKAFLLSFFQPSDKGQKAGNASWKRITSARRDHIGYLDKDNTRLQVDVAKRFMDPNLKAEGSYDRLGELKIPVLVVNGSNDLLIPTVNSWVLWKKLINAEAALHIFPECGHGFLNEYAGQLSKLIIEFLDGDGERSKGIRSLL